MDDLVTVYIPTFNRRSMLERAVSSVLSQTYVAVEVIIVDDGSSDGTVEYLSSVDDHRLHFFVNEVNSGPCVSRNRAIFSAKGKYITGLDDDDEFAPDHIYNLVSSFDEKYSLISSSMLQVTISGRVKRNTNLGEHNLNGILHYNKLTNQALMLTSRVREVGGFDESLPAMQDYDLWVRMIERYGPALKIPNTTYIWHTEHEAGRISQSSEKRRVALDRFFIKHRSKMNKSALGSYSVLRKHMLGEDLSFKELAKAINSENWRMCMALYLNGRRSYVKRAYDLLRRVY